MQQLLHNLIYVIYVTFIIKERNWNNKTKITHFWTFKNKGVRNSNCTHPGHELQELEISQKADLRTKLRGLVRIYLKWLDILSILDGKLL